MTTFVWAEREDDSTSKARVKAEVERQLDLPDTVRLVSVERLVLVSTTTERASKRTKLTAKTDYVIVLKEAVATAEYDPQSIVPFIALLLETKTAKALAARTDKYRGGAALESLAVHVRLVEDGEIGDDDFGVPVVLTDMNRYISRSLCVTQGSVV